MEPSSASSARTTGSRWSAACASRSPPRSCARSSPTTARVA